MELMQWLTIAVFTITIIAVVANWIDSTAAALVGVAVMIWMGVMSEMDAFKLVDWNVMAILVGIWIIAGYFGKSGVPSWLSVQALKLSGGRPGLLVMILAFLAGIISMFVDNVVTILMMAPVALPLARALKLPVFPLVLMIGLAANFMGSALIIGDLPPQMLHSVAGAEFFDFIWHQGRPSSFPILMVTFIITLGFMWWYGFRKAGQRRSVTEAGIDAHIPDRLFATIAVGMFLLTVVGRSMREYLGVQLGLIAMTGAVITVLILEVLGQRTSAPKFEEIIQELDWRAIFFYIALFALVGGLVEHDAYILTFLYTIRDLGAAGIEPWPLYWMLLWCGTLGSNLTVAGAPAPYVALTIAEKEEQRKVTLREFLAWSIPFALVSSFICYVLGMLIWVLPYVK